MDNIRVAKVDKVTLEDYVQSTTPNVPPTRRKRSIILHLTPHHLIFCPPPESSGASSSSSSTNQEEIWVPYPSITLCKRLPQTITGLYPVQIRTRTFESYVLLFDKDRDGGAEDVWLSVKDCAVATSVEQLYAFFYTLPGSSTKTDTPKPTLLHTLSSPLSLGGETSTPSRPSTPSSSSIGWNTFNPRTEFGRQGLGTRTKAWRFTEINKDYSFCPTYPSKLVVPSRISDSTLSYAGKYRSKARIPALTYLHWANHASITRSSQPMVGLKNARSAQDERLVECIFSSHHAPDSAYATPSSSSAPSPSTTTHVYGATTTNLIIDARPTANAMANVAVGAGSEVMDNYRSAKKAYLGIDNIHVMRNSLKTVAEAIREVEDGPSTSIDRGLLRKSGWLKHISTLLDGALVIVKNIHLNASHVLIHCSDGWDRTSQLSALAQVCLDPYYRSLDGFKVLIEKDWVAFGHKFLDRSGHLSSEKLFTVEDTPDDESGDEGLGGAGVGAQKAAQAFLAWGQKQFASNSHVKETSPVFHQFLDCVRQLQRQFPDRFEFNEDYLLDLHYHLYACQFGTFLFNNEKDRRVGNSGKSPYIDQTISAWEWFDRPDQRGKYLNPEFNSSLDDRDSRAVDADQGVLIYDPRDVKFWHRLFRRGDEEMNGSGLAALPATGGADFSTVSPGQADPVSVEAMMSNDRELGEDGIVKGATGDGSGVPASTALFGQEASTRNQNNRSRNTIAAGGGGGWNWTTVSSGAFSALQGAARDLRSIGAEAMNQIRAEASEVNGEMWSKGDDPQSEEGSQAKSWVAGGVGQGGEGRLPRTIGRIPSEANPWSTSSMDSSPSILSSQTPTQTQTQTQVAPTNISGARSLADRKSSWNVNPWTNPAQSQPPTHQATEITRDTSSSMAKLSIDTSSPMTATATTVQTQHDVVPTETTSKKGSTVESKAWDPLGAL